VEIVTGVQVGLLEANDTARDTLSGAMDVRYALTDRLEIEARVPYVYRHDRVTTVAQQNTQTTRTYELEGADIGDVEFSARYQLNRGRNGGPIFVAGARVKSNSGRSPFDLARDEFGVSTELATGSGFWGVQGSLSVLYPTDPVVLFGNVSYLYNIADDVNADIGTAHVGRVDPGDSIGVGFGFGFALNPRFSYSLGYSHSYITETDTEINGTTQRSAPLQVGTLQFGMSFRATQRLTISTGVDVGVTDDAPDVRVSLRTPFRW
jgi:outer membrane protein assembly factor BamA